MPPTNVQTDLSPSHEKLLGDHMLQIAKNELYGSRDKVRSPAIEMSQLFLHKISRSLDFEEVVRNGTAQQLDEACAGKRAVGIATLYSLERSLLH